MACSILIIDDEKFNRDILKIYLTSLKYELFEADCGTQGLQMVEENHPDLILLDIMMPDLDGYEVCKILNEKPDFDIPIILLTAKTGKESMLQGLACGAFDYLTKPFDLDLLEKKLAIALQHKKKIPQIFNTRLESTIQQSKSEQSMACVMYIDLDRFTLINESLGHDTGNLLLKEVAKRLTASVQVDNSVYRMEGNKYTIIIPDINNIHQPAAEANTIIRAFEAPFHVNGQEIYLSISIGISIYPVDGKDAKAIEEKANIALNRVKSEGGNNYQFYLPDMNSSAIERLKMENCLRKALERQELSLFYQPRIDISTGQTLGMEALLRWKNSNLGFVSPVDFIPIAEETGLIIPIGEWVLRTACFQNKAWYDSGFGDLRVSVNISSRQFQNGNLVETVKQILQESGLKPDLLELEITESILMQNTNNTVTALSELKALGIHISIDDFGTGYSSLSYLKKFPIHCIKIDKSFVGDITDDCNQGEIAAAIIALGHNLNLRVVAEGVEKEEQLQFLREHNCDEIQGYLFSRPLPPHEFKTLIGPPTGTVVLGKK